MIEQLYILNTGYCVHPECTVIRGGSLRLADFPSTVVVLVHRQKGIALFDTGYSRRFQSETSKGLGRIYAMTTPVRLTDGEAAIDQLKELGVTAKDVRTIILSHFHADHIAGLRDFPESRLVYKQEAWQTLQGLGAVARLRRGFLPGLLPTDFMSRSLPLSGTDLKKGILDLASFKDGYDVFGDHSVVAVDLPGHAAGHIGILVHYGGEDYFFVADAAWTKRSITEYRPPSRLASLIMDDATTCRSTLSKLHQLANTHPKVKIIPCHCTASLGSVSPSRSGRQIAAASNIPPHMPGASK